MTKSYVIPFITLFVFAGCASAPKAPKQAPPIDRESAIFTCKQNLQTKKKAHFETLPPLLKRLAGDNQVLREMNRPLTKREIWQAIAKYPLTGDSGGTWRLKKDAQLRTVTTRFELPSATDKDPTPTELVSLIFGQPGRVYSFPVANLKGSKNGLSGKSLADMLELKVIDEHHVLVHATTTTPAAGPAKHQSEGPAPSVSLFYPTPVYAVVRTYVEQEYDDEAVSQLSDYPIYDARMTEEACE